MVDVTQFEGLLEALSNEIDELPQGSAKENLMSIHSALYGIFEEVSMDDTETLEREHTIMKALLEDRLSHEDKVYYRIKYNIDLGV